MPDGPKLWRWHWRQLAALGCADGCSPNCCALCSVSISVSSALRSCPCMRTRLLEWSSVPHWIYIAAQQLLGALGLPRLNRCRSRDLWQRQWGCDPAKPNESCNASMSSGRARSQGDGAGQVSSLHTGDHRSLPLSRPASTEGGSQAVGCIDRSV